MANWIRFNIKDFALTKEGKPYLYAEMGSYGMRGQQPRKKPVFFPSKIDGDTVLVPASVVDELECNSLSLYKVRFPLPVRTVSKVNYSKENEEMKYTDYIGKIVKNNGKGLYDLLNLDANTLRHVGNFQFTAKVGGKNIRISTKPADDIDGTANHIMITGIVNESLTNRASMIK